MIAAEWNAIGVSTLTRYAPPEDLWGPLGYQFSDRMTGCLYTWTNANDPDDLFYWHSSQIPVSPGGSGGNLPAFFYPYSFQEEIDALTANAASTLDFAQRQDIYAEIQALLLEEVPVIFLYWEEAFPAARANVGGFWPSAWTPLLWNAADWYLVEAGLRLIDNWTRGDLLTWHRQPARRPGDERVDLLRAVAHLGEDLGCLLAEERRWATGAHRLAVEVVRSAGRAMDRSADARPRESDPELRVWPSSIVCATSRIGPREPRVVEAAHHLVGGERFQPGLQSRAQAPRGWSNDRRWWRNASSRSGSRPSAVQKRSHSELLPTAMFT